LILSKKKKLDLDFFFDRLDLEIESKAILLTGPALGIARCSTKPGLQMLRASNKKLNLIPIPYLNKKKMLYPFLSSVYV